MTATQKKNKNPLYVVTNNGQDVEQAKGMFDLWIKKLGLDPIIEMLEFLFKSLLNMVSSYAMLTAVKDVFDGHVAQFQFILSKLGLGPIVPYPQED